MCQRHFRLLMQCVKAFVNKRFYKNKTMASTSVRCVKDEERMQISVVYSADGISYRTYNLNRIQLESVSVAFDRLKLNLLKTFLKKNKERKNVSIDSCTENHCTESCTDNEEKCISVTIVNSRGINVDDSLPNNVAWSECNKLRIGSTDIDIYVNLPTVKIMPFSASIMAGFPIFPKFELEFSDLQYCSFIWERINSLQNEKNCLHDSNLLRYTDIVYTPKNEDVGHCVKLKIIPGTENRTGQDQCVMSQEVNAGPGLCPFEGRHLFTQLKTDVDSFRVVSYNILADIYSDSDYSREVLFPYCPAYALNMDYRRHLLLKEIAGYNTDIVCLQEVDKKGFTAELLQPMDFLGFTGFLKTKGTSNCEGPAIFINRDKFRIVEHNDVSLSDVLLSDAMCEDLRKAMESVPALRTKMSERGTVLQTIVLEALLKPGCYICLANTHLYFHPSASHVRLLHVAAALRHIDRVRLSYSKQGKDLSVVFCGDFNSTPETGVIQFITKKWLPHHHPDWTSGVEEERMQGVVMQHNIDLVSACGTVDYTNYTPTFNGMLDYVFIDACHLAVEQVVPMPSHEEVTQYSGLPSVVFPSDHIAQVCDLSWRF